MRFSVALACLLVLIATPLGAQAATLAWTAPDNAVTVAEAQALVYTLYVNNGSGQVVTGVSCSGAVGAFACVAPIPASVPMAIGTRVELTAKTATSQESPRSVPFISPPTAPTNLRRP